MSACWIIIALANAVYCLNSQRFYNLEIQIGGSTSDVVLSHWRGLKDTEKVEIMTTTK